MMLLGVSCDPIPELYPLLRIESNPERCLGVLVAPPSQRGVGPISAGEPPDNYTSCVNLIFYKRNLFLCSPNHNFRQNGMRPISIDSSDKERVFLGLVRISFFFIPISEFSLNAKL